MVPSGVHGWMRPRAQRIHADALLAGVLLLVTFVTTLADPGVEVEQTGAAELVAAAVACGALGARRKWPLGVLVVSTLAAESYLALFHGRAGELILVAPLIALYSFVETRGRRRALTIGGLAVLVLAGIHMVIKPYAWIGAETLALVALGGLAVAAGDAARNRRSYLAEVEARAARAEQDREREAQQLVDDERLRIARDLHDVVGHQLALINVQSGVADHVLDTQPALAREALSHVRTASRAALDELRDTVGLLRTADQPAPVDPAVGLAGLPVLVGDFERSGLHVTQEVRGEAHPLPAVVDLTAFRLIQEALTNVVKHAGVARASLRLEYGRAELGIRVDNRVAAGSTRAPATGAHGIVGMRERVTALGGTFEAGPHPVGFRVVASIPLLPRGAA